MQWRMKITYIKNVKKFTEFNKCMICKHMIRRNLKGVKECCNAWRYSTSLPSLCSTVFLYLVSTLYIHFLYMHNYASDMNARNLDTWNVVMDLKKWMVKKRKHERSTNDLFIYYSIYHISSFHWIESSTYFIHNNTT